MKRKSGCHCLLRNENAKALVRTRTDEGDRERIEKK